MKFLLVCACLFVATNALDKEFVEKFKQLMREIGTKCVAETNASNADVAKLLTHQIPTTHEGQCTVFCIHKALKLQNSDGSLSLEAAIQSMESLKEADADLHGKFVTILNTCMKSTAVDADPCLTAKTLAECTIKEAKAVGLNEDTFEL